MSLEKAIKYGKEHRKQYYGSKSFDKTCRCGKSNPNPCPWCLSDKKINFSRLVERVKLESTQYE
jgi:hypothetical protein